MNNSSLLYSIVVQVKGVIPFDQKTKGVLGEGEQCVWHMPEYTILTGNPEERLDENIHHWVNMDWKYLLRKQIINMPCPQIRGCTKWPPEATEQNKISYAWKKILVFSMEDSVGI